MKTLFDIIDKLEEKGYSVEFDDCIRWLDIESKYGYVGIKPIFLNNENNDDVIEDYIISDFAEYDTKEMNFYLESYPKHTIMNVPNANELYTTILKWLE